MSEEQVQVKVALAFHANEARFVDAEAIHVTGGWCQRCGALAAQPQVGHVFVFDALTYIQTCPECGSLAGLDWRS